MQVCWIALAADKDKHPCRMPLCCTQHSVTAPDALPSCGRAGDSVIAFLPVLLVLSMQCWEVAPL